MLLDSYGFPCRDGAVRPLWRRCTPDHPPGTRKDQTRHHQTATIETPLESRLNFNPQSSQGLRSISPQIVPKHLKTV